MSLTLDARQRAMLLEMGVRVWQPVTSAQTDNVTPAPVSASTEPAAPARQREPATQAPESRPPDGASAHPHAPTSEDGDPRSTPLASPVVETPGRPPSPTRVTELISGIAGMDWPALTEAIGQCQACAMCLGRRAPSLAAPGLATPCDWLVVGDPPDEAQERAGQPFVGEAGLLLDNMLRALAVRRWNFTDEAGATSAPAARAYLTHVLKCRPALIRAPTPKELATCAHFLRREITLTQPRVILAMGRFAMQLLLSETPPELARLPLGKLRGQVWRFANVPVVVTYPPAFLLRNPGDKAKAWADLCLARAVALGTSGATPTP